MSLVLQNIIFSLKKELKGGKKLSHPHHLKMQFSV